MERFIQKHAASVIGVLSGFDRLVFRASLRRIAYVAGMTLFLNVRRILFKNFGRYVQDTSDRLKEVSFQAARKLNRPVQYLPSSDDDKETVARAIAKRDKVTDGLIALLTCVEPCSSYGIGPNPKTNILQLRRRLTRCLHLYYYLVDPLFGFMNARIQTWFPFNVQVCINGREWLARHMDRARLRYERRDNCFTWIEDFAQAQKLMDRQLKTAWPKALGRIATMLNPIHHEIFQGFPLDYYWSVYQSEWATDITFRDRADLQDLYPALLRHAITTFRSPDVMRFLGHKVPAHGNVHRGFRGEVVSDLKDRLEGTRIKHRIDANSIKAYDKWNNLRVECTINSAEGFLVFRRKEGDRRGKRAWLPMRRGIADLHRRARVSHAANNRYLTALASVDETTPLRVLAQDLCRPATWKGVRARPLNPWAPHDAELFEAVSRGEFTINGFRNRDLRRLLFTAPAASPQEERTHSAAVTRKLRLLRAHGLIAKVPKTHRYQLHEKARLVITALLAAREANAAELTKNAA